MPVTIADVIRELAATAPERVFARPWIVGLLASLDSAAPAAAASTPLTEPPPALSIAAVPLPPVTPAPAIPHPFASEADHQAALALLRGGKGGRFIADEFDVPLMAAAVWAQRTRAGGA